MRVVAGVVVCLVAGDVEGWIEELGAVDIKVRAAAEERLAKAGARAVPALPQAIRSEDPEVAGRAEQVLERIDPGSALRRGRRAAVGAALGWLAKKRSDDGSWPAPDGHEVSATALAVLAFLGAGQQDHDAARRGLRWLFTIQQKMMYDHAIATLALAESVARLGKPERAAQRGGDWLVAARTPKKGWRYTAGCGESDTSVTVWAARALLVAREAGLRVPDDAIAGALAWFDETTEDNYCRVGYTHRGTGRVIIPGSSEHFNHHETLTAGAGFCRLLAGIKSNSLLLTGAAMLVSKDAPSSDAVDRDYVYWHFGALFLHRAGGSAWPAWEERAWRVLRGLQRADGSWPADDRWSAQGGEVYATALCALTLEAPDRTTGGKR
jgi:hypothetical protein